MSAIDTASETWKAVSAWAQEQIAASTITLITESIEERAADHARGRIACAQNLLDLIKPKPALSADLAQSTKDDP